MKDFESTIELIKLQRATLIEVIQWLDEKNFSNTEIRSKVDVVLNHNKDMNETSEMELTKIKLV
jgi:predicted XRE-type DNA-binding protein